MQGKDEGSEKGLDWSLRRPEKAFPRLVIFPERFCYIKSLKFDSYHHFMHFYKSLIHFGTFQSHPHPWLAWVEVVYELVLQLINFNMHLNVDSNSGMIFFYAPAISACWAEACHKNKPTGAMSNAVSNIKLCLFHHQLILEWIVA